MKTGLGRSLIKSKFVSKARVNKTSIVEHSNLASLQIRGGNRLVGASHSKDASRNASAELEKHMESNKVEQDLNANREFEGKRESAVITLNFSRCIPPRVPFNSITGPQYKVCEQKMFSYWKSKQKPFPYERNLETWRQLWLTCERSDVIAQVLDARNPEFFFVKDLVEMYPEKKHVLLLNKSDLAVRNAELLGCTGAIENECRLSGFFCDRSSPGAHSRPQADGKRLIEKYEHVFYSSVDAGHSITPFLENFRGATVAFVGYPNVGKSSTINAILNGKRVQTSKTPGKTKHLQSIVLGNIVLIDCPGIVFPRHGKFDLIINGVLNVDKVVDYSKFFQKLVAHVGEDALRRKYAIRSKMSVENMWDTGAIDCGQLFKKIVKDYIAGNV